MGRTVWYPGHMEKGKRRLASLAAAIDVIIEVRDARAPALSSSPMLAAFPPGVAVWVVLSKADLADEGVTRLWTKHLRAKGFEAFALDLHRDGVGQIKKKITAKKPGFRDARVAVVGIPNVGKSMLINRLAGRRAAPVGGIPGITRGVSWFKGDGFLLVDSPGILDPHKDPRAHRIISWIGSSKGGIIGSWEGHARECISFLIKRGAWGGVESAWNVSPDGSADEILEKIGKRLGKLLSGGGVDLEAAGFAFMDAFASGRFGRMSLEKPNDPPLWESL